MQNEIAIVAPEQTRCAFVDLLPVIYGDLMADRSVRKQALHIRTYTAIYGTITLSAYFKSKS